MPERVRPLTPINESNAPRGLLLLDLGETVLRTHSPCEPSTVVVSSSPDCNLPSLSRSLSRARVQKRPYTSLAFYTPRTTASASETTVLPDLNDADDHQDAKQIVQVGSQVPDGSIPEASRPLGLPLEASGMGGPNSSVQAEAMRAPPVWRESITLSKERPSPTSDPSSLGSPQGVASVPTRPKPTLRIPVRSSSCTLPTSYISSAGADTSSVTHVPGTMKPLSPSLAPLERSVSAIDRRPSARKPARHFSDELPPRPTTSTGTRRRPSSVYITRSDTAHNNRPSSFPSPTRSFTLQRGNSLLGGCSSKQLEGSLPNLSARRDSVDLAKSRTRSRSPNRHRGRDVPERRISFKSQTSTTAPVDAEEKRRPASALNRRSSLRISSILSRFSKVPIPSPLSASIPADVDERSGPPLRAAARSPDRFGVKDDDWADLILCTPTLQFQHRRTSDGSIVELEVSRMLYAENPDPQSEIEQEEPDPEPQSPPPHTVDVTLNVDPLSLSRSPSDTSSSNTTSDSSLPAYPTSPCSTDVSGASFDNPRLTPVFHPLNPYATIPDYVSEGMSEYDILLLVSAHMLANQALALNEVAHRMRAMADETREWGARLIAMGVVDQEHDLSRSPTTAGFKITGADPSLAAIPADNQCSSESRRLPQNGEASPASSSFPGPSFATLLSNTERIGRSAWRSLHVAEDVWAKTLADFQRMANHEATPEPERNIRANPAPDFAASTPQDPSSPPNVVSSSRTDSSSRLCHTSPANSASSCIESPSTQLLFAHSVGVADSTDHETGERALCKSAGSEPSVVQGQSDSHQSLCPPRRPLPSNSSCEAPFERRCTGSTSGSCSRTNSLEVPVSTSSSPSSVSTANSPDDWGMVTDESMSSGEKLEVSPHISPEPSPLLMPQSSVRDDIPQPHQSQLSVFIEEPPKPKFAYMPRTSTGHSKDTLRPRKTGMRGVTPASTLSPESPGRLRRRLSRRTSHQNRTSPAASETNLAPHGSLNGAKRRWFSLNWKEASPR